MRLQNYEVRGISYNGLFCRRHLTAVALSISTSKQEIHHRLHKEMITHGNKVA